MLKKRLILLCISLVLIAGFFILPVNNRWGNTLINYWNDFTKQKTRLSLEARRAERFGTHYTISKAIADSLTKKAGTNQLLLIPPDKYFKKNKIDYYAPIPPVFYYFTGIKTVLPTNPHAPEAKWYVRFENGKVIVDSVKNDQTDSYE